MKFWLLETRLRFFSVEVGIESLGVNTSVVAAVDKREIDSIVMIARLRKEAYLIVLMQLVLNIEKIISAAIITQAKIEIILADGSLQSKVVPSSGGRKLVRKLLWI